MATKKDTIAIEATKDTTKATAKKTAKRTDLKAELCIQFGEKEYTDKDILKLVKAVWTKEMKRKVGEMKKVQMYMKPEESAVYFVVNSEVTGKIDL
ncbi:MAG: DUF6465 family protein [Schaedlerella sp.]|nr:DUF6465 family protein [Schaedlerella sp.]